VIAIVGRAVVHPQNFGALEEFAPLLRPFKRLLAIFLVRFGLPFRVLCRDLETGGHCVLANRQGELDAPALDPGHTIDGPRQRRTQ
jgi:hypothetical protein